MPEFTGSLKTPRLTSAPASPVAGQMYFDTTTAKLLWWNGTVWVDSTGGGGGGSTISAASACSTLQGAAVDVSGGWKAVPLPTSLTIEPSDAFTFSANSVTVKDAGWYHVAVSLMNNIATMNVLYVGLGTSPTPLDGNIANNASGSGVQYNRVGCDGSVKLTAGQKVYLYGYSPNVAPVNVSCFNFSIERIGGPQGMTGGNATVPMDPWHTVGAAGEPAFMNGWTSSTIPQLAFHKDPLGVVHIRGNIATGPTGTNVFTLPVGYRPPQTIFNVVLGSGGVAGSYINVATDGLVTAWRAGADLHLGDVEFDTGTVTQMPTGPQGPPGTPAPFVTALPASPVDGQECYYQHASMAASGEVWHLRYRAASASAYKWEMLGGSSLCATTGAGATYTTGGAYTAGPALAAPQVTAPLAGEYVYEFTLGGQLAATIVDMRAHVFVGGVSMGSGSMGATRVDMYGCNFSGAHRINVAAAAVADLRMSSSGAGVTFSVYDRSLKATPVRVG